MEDPSEPTSETNFKVQCSAFHLTYKNHLDHEQLLEFFKSINGDLKYYSFVHENGHEDEQTPYEHTHCFIKFTKKLSTRNARIFDFTYNGETIHPNIKRVTTVKHESTLYHEYHRKSPVKLTQSQCAPPIPFGNLELAIKTPNSIFGAIEALGIQPRSVADVHLLRNSKPRMEPTTSAYPDANWTLELPTAFRVLFMWGRTGTGKTQRALAAFNNPLQVSHMDDLGHFDPALFDGIVFDDMSFVHLPVTAMIHLLDWDCDRSIHIRYKTAVIPKHTRKIFTSNKCLGETFPGAPESEKPDIDRWEALLRRITRTIHVISNTYA